MVSISCVQKGFARFVDREIAPRLTITERCLVGTGAALLASKIPDLLKAYADHPVLKAMGVVDLENGLVDVNAVYDAALPYIGPDPIPLNIPIVGLSLKLGKSEVETLYKYIMEV